MQCVIVPKVIAKQVRLQLEEQYDFDNTRRLTSLGGELIAVPINSNEETLQRIRCLWPGYEIRVLDLPHSKKIQAKKTSPPAKVTSEVLKLMSANNVSDHLVAEIPKKWERHEDLIVLPASAFLSDEWNKIENLWSVVASCLSCQRLARRAAVADDGIRSSQVKLLLGCNGCVTHIDNGIKYSFDVTKCMFSIGNISEKLRVASWNCTGQIVVDLFAGIGYFTLPYLIHANAAHVHACDWNPEAIKALKQNLDDNHVADRCTVHYGDCRKLDLGSIADHINLGLIPSSEDSWQTAVNLLSDKGGFLHIHNNVEAGWFEPKDSSCNSTADDNRDGGQVNDRDNTDNRDGGQVNDRDNTSSKERQRRACVHWSQYACSKISQLLHTIYSPRRWSVRQVHLEIVKSYAPHIVHVVLDLECRPSA